MLGVRLARRPEQSDHEPATANDAVKNRVESIEGIESSEVGKRPSECGDEDKERPVDDAEGSPEALAMPAEDENCGPDEAVEDLVPGLGPVPELPIVGDEAQQDEQEEDPDDPCVPLLEYSSRQSIPL